MLPYDALVIATGAALLPGETDGLAEATERGKAVAALAGLLVGPPGRRETPPDRYRPGREPSAAGSRTLLPCSGRVTISPLRSQRYK